MDELDIGATIKSFAPGQKVFNRYTLTKMLGRGGMGVVWLARDVELGRDTALKFLPEVVATDRSAIEDMKREVRRAIDLAHPHIVKIHDFITDGRTAAVSMEYIAGGTLSSLRIDQPGQVFGVADLGRWIAQLCAALDYAHRDAEVVHRDLKPANLMVDGKGRLRVLDFGIAASISESVTRVSKQAGSSGTPVYMSPQQMMGENPAPTDDLYSVGATLFELLTGKPPFHAGNIMLQVQNKPAPLVNERRKALNLEPVPVVWEQAIAACLAKEPTERPQSGADLLKLLAGELTSPVATGATPSKPAAPAAPAQPPALKTAPGNLPGAGTSGVRRWLLAPLVASLPLTALMVAFTVGYERSREDEKAAVVMLISTLVQYFTFLLLLGIRRPWRSRGSWGIVMLGILAGALLGLMNAEITGVDDESVMGFSMFVAGCVGGFSGWLLYRVAARATLLPSGPLPGVRPGLVYGTQAVLLLLACTFFGSSLPQAARVVEAKREEARRQALIDEWAPKVTEAYRMVFDRQPDLAAQAKYLAMVKNTPWWSTAQLRDALRESPEGRQGGRLLVPLEFQTIQNAINAAKPGNVVVVAPGTYTEGLYIGRSVTLQGAGRERVTVSREGGTNVLNIDKSATGVKVSGFTFRHTTRPATERRYTTVWLAGTDVEFFNNAVVDSDGYGIYLNEAKNCTVQNNVISGSGWSGLSIHQDVSGRIVRNTLRDNRGSGIRIAEQPGSLLINDNTIHDNGDGGLLVGKGTGVEISDNHLYRNGTTVANGGIGIFNDAGRPVLRGNRAYANQGTGIWWINEASPPYVQFGNVSDGKDLPVGSTKPLR